MIFYRKKRKAFTLAEVFLAMVILSVLVAVCLSFFVKRNDYEREYMYYTAYQNLVNVVDTSLMNDLYIKGSSPRVVETNCGTSSNRTVCRAYNSTATATTGLCSIFKDYFNTVSDSCSTTTSTPATAATSQLKLINGMDFYFKALQPESVSALQNSSETLESTEYYAYVVWVDVNGHGNGEDTLHYDIFEFYITRSGKVIPVYGTVSGIRGYDYVPASMDAGGNKSLMAFDVRYTKADSNYSWILSDSYHAVAFPHAACASGYLTAGTSYCSNFKYNCDSSGNTCTTGVSKDASCTDAADCKIQLVKKLKRLK